MQVQPFRLAHVQTNPTSNIACDLALATFRRGFRFVGRSRIGEKH
jgi:hypothetical protein